MKTKSLSIALKAVTAFVLATSLLLTFTVSDYYIFNRIGEFNLAFVLSQWIKKSGLLLLPLAVFYGKRKCADTAKYVLPIVVLLSCYTCGGFFSVTKISDAADAQQVYAHINEFIPKWLNMTLFYLNDLAMLVACALLFIRDGFKTEAKSWAFLPFAVVAVMPLNIFENFFDINAIPGDSVLRFNSFTVWHLVALLGLAGFTIGAYYFLKRVGKERSKDYLAAMAIVLLLQYHCKDSMVLGDGYNVYHTVFACIPLFICNIGVYVASLSVLLKKRVLYAISFFIHAAGALTVFIYFGKPEMSNYGIFCSYSILYFMLTHCLLFALSVLPAALGHYKFKPKDCIVPLAYYFVVIVTASVASALVTSASMGFSANGYTLQNPNAAGVSEWLYPNYAFTQINPLPFEIPPILTLRIWNYDINVLYVLGLYAAYVAIFYVFNGAYYAFLGIRKKLLARPTVTKIIAPTAEAEAAASVDSGDDLTAPQDGGKAK